MSAGPEEWWGRTFEGRGSTTLFDMPEFDPATIRKLSTMDVLEMRRSEGDRSARGILAQMEIQRRANWTGRTALVVSVTALLVSALSAIFRA